MSVHLKRLHNCMLLVYVYTCGFAHVFQWLATHIYRLPCVGLCIVCMCGVCLCVWYKIVTNLLLSSLWACYQNLSFGILSAPVHLHPRCHTGVSRVWGHTGRGWGPQEETGSTEDQRQIWKHWNGPAVCRNVYSYSHTPFSTVHHCLCV